MKWEEPMMEIVILEERDILCASTLDGNPSGDNNEEWEW